MVAHLRRHVADQRREHRLLAVEVSVEGAERDLGAAGDPDDRAVAKIRARRIRPAPRRGFCAASFRRAPCAAPCPRWPRWEPGVPRSATRLPLASRSLSRCAGCPIPVPHCQLNKQVESRFNFHYDMRRRRRNRGFRQRRKGEDYHDSFEPHPRAGCCCVRPPLRCRRAALAQSTDQANAAEPREPPPRGDR